MQAGVGQRRSLAARRQSRKPLQASDGEPLSLGKTDAGTSAVRLVQASGKPPKLMHVCVPYTSEMTKLSLIIFN